MPPNCCSSSRRRTSAEWAKPSVLPAGRPKTWFGRFTRRSVSSPLVRRHHGVFGSYAKWRYVVVGCTARIAALMARWCAMPNSLPPKSCESPKTKWITRGTVVAAGVGASASASSPSSPPRTLKSSASNVADPRTQA